MRFVVFATCLVLLQLNLVYSLATDNVIRLKRSNDTEGNTLQKIKDGAKTIGSKVSSYATKGYEELKNLFSPERKVGDYTRNNIDVRVRDEEDYEEVAVKRPKRDLKTQDIDEKSVDFVVNLDEILKDINVLDNTERLRSTTPENNAEVQPGLPPQYSVNVALLQCPDNMKDDKGLCRTLT